MTRVLIGLAIGTSFTLGGCATILGGTRQTISINSNVSGAQVMFNNTQLGVTPLTTTLQRGQTGVIQVRAPGYQSYDIALNKKISSLFWVNIFSGGVVGSTTDAATGAMYEYEPSTFMVTLQRPSPNPIELAAWRRKEGLRAFVLQNNQALVSELALGKGEYVDVLAQILAVPIENRRAAVTRWRSAYLNSKTAAEFAEVVVAELR